MNKMFNQRFYFNSDGLRKLYANKSEKYYCRNKCRCNLKNLFLKKLLK